MLSIAVPISASELPPLSLKWRLLVVGKVKSTRLYSGSRQPLVPVYWLVALIVEQHREKWSNT